MKSFPQTRVAVGIFGLGLIQCVLLLLIALTPLPETANAGAHPEFAGMAVGNNGAARFAPIADIGYWFQVIVLAQICLMIALGVSPRNRTHFFWAALTFGFGCGVFVWWQMFVGYEAFLATGETEFVAGFPVATAWQVYAVWLAGLALVGLYVFGFRRYVWSEADQQAFEALVKGSRQA